MRHASKIAINLGGEGEIPGVINQQGPWVVTDPHWRTSRDGKTFPERVAEGIPFLICPNHDLPYPDESVRVVYTIGVPVDRASYYGPGVYSSEIVRILEHGGEWYYDDGQNVWVWTKP
jgi:hypothetical protein